MGPKKDFSKPPPYLEKYRKEKLQEAALVPPPILPQLKTLKNLTPSQVSLLGNSAIFTLLFIVVTNLQVFFKDKPLDYYAGNPLMFKISTVFIKNEKLYILFAIGYGLQSVVCDFIIPERIPNMKPFSRVVTRLSIVILVYNIINLLAMA